MPASIAIASGLIFIGGAVLTIRRDGFRSLWRLTIKAETLFFLVLLFGFSYLFNHVLPLFDDFAHLPTVSLLAAGQIPLYFPLDPSISYAYHYFLLLFAGQIVRISHLSPWVALDFAHALVFSIGVTLAAQWALRLTQSKAAAQLSGFAMVFASGTRWLLMFLPKNALDRLSDGIQLIGSGIASGPNLFAALRNSWMIEGHPDVRYPFAFGSGIFSNGFMGMPGPNSLMIIVVFSLLMLTGSR